MGKHIFKTYWIRSAGDISSGIELISEDSLMYVSRYLNTLNQLQPYALLGNDIEYANLLWHTGKFYRNRIKDYPKALYYHGLAKTYAPDFEANYVPQT